VLGVKQPRAAGTGVVELLGDFSSWSAHCVEISSRTTRTQDEAVKKAENLPQNVPITQLILLIGAR
jgi:hypothetical protein